MPCAMTSASFLWVSGTFLTSQGPLLHPREGFLQRESASCGGSFALIDECDHKNGLIYIFYFMNCFFGLVLLLVNTQNEVLDQK